MGAIQAPLARQGQRRPKPRRLFEIRRTDRVGHSSTPGQDRED